MCSRVPYKRVGACLCFTLLEGLELRRLESRPSRRDSLAQSGPVLWQSLFLALKYSCIADIRQVFKMTFLLAETIEFSIANRRT